MNDDERIDFACELRGVTLDLKALICSVEDEYSCYQILCKLGSIRQALCDLRHALIAYQIRKSILVIQNQHDYQAQLRELVCIQDLFIEKIQNQ